jgi:hypothetical protein
MIYDSKKAFYNIKSTVLGKEKSQTWSETDKKKYLSLQGPRHI